VPSTSRKVDGIYLDRKHIPRTKIVESIYAEALAKQFVVLRAPASTGKTSVLTLLGDELKKKKANVINFSVRRIGIEKLLESLYDVGIPKQKDKLQALENTWLLLDDAQNAYTEDYQVFWEIVVKDVGAAGAKGLYVVIATTYNLSTPGSAVNFRALEHVDPNFSQQEANELIILHIEHWGYQGWEQFNNTLLGLCELSGEDDKFHAGVIMAAIRVVEGLRKKLPGTPLTEDSMLEHLRMVSFASNLDRCFYLKDGTVTKEMKDHFMTTLLSDATQQREDFSRSAIAALIRAGLVNQNGKFSCLAAQWYYNRCCFPNRPLEAPETLKELIVKVVGSMSAKQLRDSVQDGFPKETAFQQLLNETMSMHLPARSIVILEFNTRAVDSQDSKTNPVTGELDFYVSSNKQWCIELLRGGRMAGEHLGRFGGKSSKYRKVKTKEYYVVDCRGPKKGRGAHLEDHRCTLYFSDDFSNCHCEIKGHDGIDIQLQM
jgi:hypothetical protein